MAEVWWITVLSRYSFIFLRTLRPYIYAYLPSFFPSFLSFFSFSTHYLPLLTYLLTYLLTHLLTSCLLNCTSLLSFFLSFFLSFLLSATSMPYLIKSPPDERSRYPERGQRLPQIGDESSALYLNLQCSVRGERNRGWR